MNRNSPSRVVVITDFSTTRGGASKLAILHARLLADRNVPVTLFAGDAGQVPRTGIDLVAVGGESLLDAGRLRAATSGIWNSAALRGLRQWIAENDDPFTVYHVHGYLQTLSPSILTALKPVARRTFLHGHDYFMSCPNGGFFDYRESRTCLLKPMSAACITHNCDKRSYAQKLWRVGRQFVQNNGLKRLLPEATTILIHSGMEPWLSSGHDFGQFVTVANPAEAFVEEPTTPSRNKGFYFVGDIHVYKGVFLLAEAARRALVPLHFIGKGSSLAQLQQQYPEHHYEGWQDREGLARLLGSARCVIAPSLGPEPFGLAPVEALLSGIPIIIADRMLLSEEVNALEMGCSFPSGDLDALAASLRRLAGDDRLVDQYAKNARTRARTIALTPDLWCDALVSLYENTLESAARTLPGHPVNPAVKSPKAASLLDRT